MCIRDRYWKREKNLKYGSGMKSEDEYYANDKKGLGGAKYKFDYIKSPLKHDKFIEFKHFLDGNVRMKALELSERRSSSGKRKRISIDLSLIHICRCRRYAVCRSRWSPYH
eukprot:TRINITY_DN15010_c0_g1_i1.p1 TRINITY_DN15010_c0_g1~~TRINITY_DN15010_c0_g1_i1.p1  ORF type:complete len:111 (-),score=20.31 TRINITY_DN15010_c0_g1_i1:13-345(-)